MSDFSESKRVVTRKEHFCEGCLENIPKGATAEHNKGKWCGDFYDYHLCIPCAEYANANPETFEEGFCTGEIGEYRREAAKV